jgi:Protein kinase domain/Ankyrin repeats (many copies)/Ankyrin repeat
MHITKLAIDSIIDDRYQLVELLGEGGSGSTYRAMRLADGATVAIKILSLRHLNDWKQLELFEREAKVLAQINHPQIPKYLEYFHVDTPDNRAFYIVQQLAPGRPLTDWVQSGWRGTEVEVRDIASQLLEILQYLHHQSPPLIHRDLKPHNIIRNDDGRIFLVDFGAVQNVYHNTLLKGCTVAGTFGYMAPEQFRGAAVPASDLYGLGATILYLLTHRSPADLPQERLKLNFRAHVNISNHFAEWLEMMLEPDTSDRFSSASIALSALQKQHRFRIQTGTKIGFPWKGMAIVTAIATIFVPLIYLYRYAFIARLGLPAYEICNTIQAGDIQTLDEHLNRGLDINANVAIHDDDGTKGYPIETGSLLHCAIAHRQIEIIKDLLDRGADVESLNSGNLSPINDAICFCSDYDESCQTAAGKTADTKIVSLLLEHKANINAEDRNGNTPIRSAVQKLNPLLFDNLIGHGANPYIISYEKRLSLWHSLVISMSYYVSSDDYDAAAQTIAKRLIALKLDLNKPNRDGDTPLHIAMQNNNQKAIDLLQKYGARDDIRNHQGQSPLDLRPEQKFE